LTNGGGVHVVMSQWCPLASRFTPRTRQTDRQWRHRRTCVYCLVWPQPLVGHALSTLLHCVSNHTLHPSRVKSTMTCSVCQFYTNALHVTVHLARRLHGPLRIEQSAKSFSSYVCQSCTRHTNSSRTCCYPKLILYINWPERRMRRTCRCS